MVTFSIAGTGRSGTSFLVKYLDGLGLETGIGAKWHELANAGGETRPFASPSAKLPYVIEEFAWTSEFIDQLLVDDQIALEVAIIPVRDLIKSATSRAITTSCDLRGYAGCGPLRGVLGNPGGQRQAALYIR